MPLMQSILYSVFCRARIVEKSWLGRICSKEDLLHRYDSLCTTGHKEDLSLMYRAFLLFMISRPFLQALFPGWSR